jgi:transcriptional regulator with XRE-family HTH domain
MAHPIDVHVGQRIRQQRWAKSMTQKELAKAIGIKFQQIQKYESGSNRVSASRLWEISTALSVPINFFFDGLDIQYKNSHYTELSNSKEAQKFIRLYYMIPETKRKPLLDLARALTEKPS